MMYRNKVKQLITSFELYKIDISIDNLEHRINNQLIVVI